MFDLLQPTHLLFILLVALVVLGPKRLAQTSRSLGRGLRELTEYRDEFKEGLLGKPGEGESEEKRSEEKRPRIAEEKGSKEKESGG